MLIFIDEILKRFQSCFSRKAAYGWFVILVTGFMLRSDHLGVTSVIRDLAIRPDFYETMLHFFRASSWTLDGIRQTWYQTVRDHAPLHKVAGYTVLIGDGVKQAKEARFMPGIKKLFQESENSSKPQYIFGHMFGGLGVLIGDRTKWFCLPLSIRLHDGLQPAASWKESGISAASHVIRMVEDGYKAAKTFGRSLLLLDRYFLSVPALVHLAQLNAKNQTHLELITKAKSNCMAYELPPERKPGRGRPAKKGAPVKLKALFTSGRHLFQETILTIYGKEERVRFYCTDLLWGQKLYQKLRFVLVEYNGSKSILVSTDSTLSPETIIRLYSYRFRIECCFRELKQQIGCFCYHFWTQSMPRLSHYRKKDAPHPLASVMHADQRLKILKTVQAIEGHVMLSLIAMGILQMISLKFSSQMHSEGIRYLRTPSLDIVSEASVMAYLRRHFFRLMAHAPFLSVTRFISERQLPPSDSFDSLAS